MKDKYQGEMTEINPKKRKCENHSQGFNKLNHLSKVTEIAKLQQSFSGLSFLPDSLTSPYDEG